MEIPCRVEDDNFLEIAPGQLHGNLPGLQVLQEIFAADVPDGLDDVGALLLLYQRLYSRPHAVRHQLPEETVRLLLGAALGHHYQLHDGAAPGNAEVVPDVLGGIHVQRGLVFIAHGRSPHILLLSPPGAESLQYRLYGNVVQRIVEHACNFFTFLLAESKILLTFVKSNLTTLSFD